MSASERVRQTLFIQARNEAIRYKGQLDNELSQFAVLTDLEQRTQIPKTYTVLATLVLIFVLHTFNASAAPISNLVGWAFPAYLSLKAVETPSSNGTSWWLKYWVVLSFIGFVESFSVRLILYYVPWYFVLKSLVVIWLQYRDIGRDSIVNQYIIKESEASILDSDFSKSNPCGLVKRAYNTAEKVYYKSDKVFIKRNLDPSEYLVLDDGDKYVPYMCLERMRNEVATIRYVQKNTNIPTPNIRCAFEDNGRFYLITDIVPGVTLDELPVEKRARPIKEVEEFMAKMHTIKSTVMGGMSGDNILPARITCTEPLPEDRDPKFAHLKFRDASTPEFVFCHNDLGQHNVIVDEETLRVKAILDWEYAGFYPPEFDGKFYLRPGCSAALEGEENDVPKLMELLEFWKA